MANKYLRYCLFIKYRWTDILFITVILLCLWVIVAVGLNCSFLKVSCDYGIKTTENINTVLLNFSYSYIAGCIFYLLSVTFPKYRAKKIIRKGIMIKKKSIQKILNHILQCFSEGTQLSAEDHSEENIQNIFVKKNWNDMDAECKLLRYNKTTIQACNLHNQYLKEEIDDLIIKYKEYLSEEVLSLLEELRDSQFIKNVAIFSRLNSFDVDVKSGLATEYIKMLDKYKTLEGLI